MIQTQLAYHHEKWGQNYLKCAQWRFWSELNLRWVDMSKGTFSDVMAKNVKGLVQEEGILQ